MKKLLVVLVAFLITAHVNAQTGGLNKTQIAKLESIMAPLRLKVETTLKNTNASLYKSYQADIKLLTKINDPVKLKAELTKLKTKYYAFIKDGYQKSQIDEVGTKEKINLYLKSINFTATIGEFLSMRGSKKAPPQNSNPQPTSTCVELKCPMNVKNTTNSSNVDAFGVGSAEDCRAFTLSASVFAGSVENITKIGRTTPVQSSIQSVDVSFKLDYFMQCVAWACVGGSYADVSVGIEINGPSISNHVDFATGWVVSPVVWYSYFEEAAENNSMQTSFRPSSNGGDYTIQPFAKSYAFSAVISATTCNSEIKDFDPITVCQNK